MSKIKLICVDMDGTLLDKNHNVSEENKLALQEANKMGCEIAITTGRIFCSAKFYSDLIGVDTPIIASNGAYICKKTEEKAILENTLTYDQLIKVYEVIKKYGLHPNFNTLDTVIRELPLPENHAYLVMNKDLKEEDKVKFIINDDLTPLFKELNGKILKGIVIEEGTDKTKLFAAKEELKNLFGYELHIVSSGENNFEIMPGNSSKGNAVKHLAEMLGFKREEVMCIGDSENDLSMIKYAGIGVAMGNGLQLLKDAADYITATNEESGVAKAVRKFVLDI